MFDKTVSFRQPSGRSDRPDPLHCDRGCRERLNEVITWRRSVADPIFLQITLSCSSRGGSHEPDSGLHRDYQSIHYIRHSSLALGSIQSVGTSYASDGLVIHHARSPRLSISTPVPYIKSKVCGCANPNLQFWKPSSKCPNHLFSCASPDAFSDAFNFAYRSIGYRCLWILGISCCGPTSQSRVSSPGVGPLHRPVLLPPH